MSFTYKPLNIMTLLLIFFCIKIVTRIDFDH